MRTRTTRQLAWLTLLLVPPLWAQQDLFGIEPRERPPFETVEVTISHVAGNIYQIRGEGGNIGMSVGEDGIILIDDQFAPLSTKILAAIRTVSDAPIRFLINTHVHEDHTGGNENFADLGAIIVAHDRVRIRLMEGIRGGPPAPAAALPVVTFSHPVSLHLNGEEVRIIPVPAAHTDGDAYVHFVGSNVIHLGDVFRTNGYPNIDLGNGGTLEGTLESLQIAIDLAGPETLLIPGHGVVSKRDAAIELRDLTLEVRARVARLVEQGMSLEQVVAAKPTADLDERWGPRLDRFLPAVFYGVGGQD
jgi:glyoxylase-like metal-dependent hydrolase (beta-lactamase superfamily II)